MNNNQEINSIYDKISLGDKLKKHTEAHNAKSIVPFAKRMIFGEKCAAMNYEKACQTFDYIIKEIVGIDEKTFLSIYNSKMLKELRIKNLADYIIKNAPTELIEICSFDKKRILFCSVWPKFYEKEFIHLNSKDIFFCKGELKGNLIKAATPKYDSLYFEMNDVADENIQMPTKKRKSSAMNIHGKTVDNIVYDALVDVLDSADMTIEDQFTFLAHYKSIYKKKDMPVPGIFSVIESRQCYECALDFYMFNSPVNVQVEYIDTYMRVRKNAGFKQNPVIEAIYDAYQANFNKPKEYEFDLEKELEGLKSINQFIDGETEEETASLDGIEK